MVGGMSCGDCYEVMKHYYCCCAISRSLSYHYCCQQYKIFSSTQIFLLSFPNNFQDPGVECQKKSWTKILSVVGTIVTTMGVRIRSYLSAMFSSILTCSDHIWMPTHELRVIICISYNNIHNNNNCSNIK